MRIFFEIEHKMKNYEEPECIVDVLMVYANFDGRNMKVTKVYSCEDEQLKLKVTKEFQHSEDAMKNLVKEAVEDFNKRSKKSHTNGGYITLKPTVFNECDLVCFGYKSSK